MRQHLRSGAIAVLAFLFVLAGGRLEAQNASGSIVGHVKDSTGAAVAAARVSVANIDTHDVRTVSTNGTGDYTVPVLQPGHYEVEVASTGFKSEKHSGIVLDVDQTVRVETVLTVGASTETVTVNSQALALDTDRSCWTDNYRPTNRGTAAQRPQLSGSDAAGTWGRQQPRRRTNPISY